MARVRRAAPALQGPSRLVWFLRVRRSKAPPPPPPSSPPSPPPSPSPSPAPSPSSPPSPAPSPSPPPPPPPPPLPASSPNASPAPIPPHSSSETTSLAPIPPHSSSETAPTASLAVTPLHSSSETTSLALVPPHSSSETAPTASLAVTPPRATNKRKADESLRLGSDSDGHRNKVRRGETSSSSSAAAAVRRMVTLEEIRALPQSGTRPFYPRTLRRGIRSLKEPKPWKCSECGNVNDPTRHLLFDLPAFKCKACNAEPRKGDADFGFCYGDLAMNEACPIGHVKMQRQGECIPNTLLSCVEITHRIMSTILEHPLSKQGPCIDINDLLLKYKKRWVEEGNKKMDSYSGLSLLTMMRVFQIDGVKEKNTSGLRKKTNKLHKVSDWEWVNQNDFAAMSSAVADGYPLICLYKQGTRLANLKPGDIYVPPLHDATGGHASLLVGAHQEGRVKFLYFLSSTGERWCQRSDSKGDGIRGGIGAIIPGRFDFDLIQIFRFNERAKQAVQKH